MSDFDLNNYDYSLDARRLLCPMPVIKTQNKIKELIKNKDSQITQNNQAILKIICTDPGAQHDIPTWARINKHKTLHIHHDLDHHEYWIYILIIFK